MGKPAHNKMTPREILLDAGFEDDGEPYGLEKYVKGDITVATEFDEDPTSPREDDNVMIIALYPRCTYDFDDKRLSDPPKNAINVMPLYVYEHGGLAVSIGSHNFPDARWDVCTAGFVYTTKRHFNTNCGSEMTNERLQSLFKGEIEELNAYLSGQIFTYAITKTTECSHGCEHEETIDNEAGYYSEDEALMEAIGTLRYLKIIDADSPRKAVQAA